MVAKYGFKIVVLFILAITRFRFPRHESVTATVRRRYGGDIVKLIRKFERTDKKLRKAELDQNFLEKCVELSVIPKFLNFKVTNEHLRKSPTYDACRRSLLAEEITHKVGSVSTLKSELLGIKDELQGIMNVIDFTHVSCCFLQVNDKFIDSHKLIQDKKLCELVELSSAFQNDPEKVIHNFSDYQLSNTEKAILVKGLNFSVSPGKLNYGDYCAGFELLFRDIKGNGNLSERNLDVAKTKLKDIALSSFEEHNRSPDKFGNLTKEETECLKKLSENKDIVIQKSDKGNSIVVLNRSDYCERVKVLLSDSSKFEVANIREGKMLRHLTNIRIKFKKIIDKLLLKEKISLQTFRKLDPIGAAPGVLYGLSKIHKALVNGLPKMRPILSAIGTAGYGLSKFLVPILEPVAFGPYTVSNSFAFNKEVLEQDATLFMGSLDVDALFTSIPLDETIKICTDELFKERHLVHNLGKTDVKNLLELSCKNSLFIFDGVYYNQLDGVAMGSPLGPSLANAFMNFHEKNWLSECPPEIKPVFYRRYVDDIFVLCHSEEKMNLFKDYLNSQHENINFTSEIENGGSLPFLDILIGRNDGKFVTSVYRKPTFTGVYTHFHSFLPSMYKFGLLSTILFRYFSICSSFQLFHLEVVEFKKIFLRNGYPSKIIDACIRKFLEKLFVTKVVKDTVPRRDYVIVLPYLGPLSDKIKRRLRNLFRHFLPAGKINLILKTQRRLSHFLKFKDVIPRDLSSHLIYHFKCPCCLAGYIGETRTHYKVRVSQHLGISEWTGVPTKGGLPTAITNHIISQKCKCSFTDFKIIGREADYHLRLLKESLFIKFYDYELNKQQTYKEVHLF